MVTLGALLCQYYSPIVNGVLDAKVKSQKSLEAKKVFLGKAISKKNQHKFVILVKPKHTFWRKTYSRIRSLTWSPVANLLRSADRLLFICNSLSMVANVERPILQVWHYIRVWHHSLSPATAFLKLLSLNNNTSTLSQRVAYLIIDLSVNIISTCTRTQLRWRYELGIPMLEKWSVFF